PQDKGTAAWLVLLGASITEVVSCCMSKNYGVFRDYYFTHAPFTGIDILVVAGGVSEGCLALVISFLLSLIKRRPAWRKRMMILGMLPCVLGSSIGGAFSNQAWQIIVSQGAVYGSGAGTMSASAVSYVDGWFDKRQSFAYGVMYGMSRLIETFLPFVYVASLHSFGQRGTLLGHGCGALLLSTIALFCVRPRTPEPPKQQPVESTRDYSFAKRASFYLLGSSTILQALVLNLPAIYLPSFTTELGYSAAQGAITIAMFNLATWVGGFCFGLLADHRRSFYSSLFLGTVLSGLIVIFFWAEAKSLMAIVVFAFIYGWASGGFVSLRSRFANTIVGDSKDQAMTVFGTFTIARGVRLITIGGFIGQALVDESVERRLMDYRMRKWVHLMLFVGFGMLAA
ncbi:MFS general substrate transporter, partial [Polyplosphaeria fusca]